MNPEARINEAIAWLDDAIAFLKSAKRESTFRYVGRANHAVMMAETQLDAIVADEIERSNP